MFKKTSPKLSLQFIMLQKYSDKLTANVTGFLKRYLIVRCRINFVLTRFSQECSYFLKPSLWRSLYHISIDLQTCFYVIEICESLIDYVSYCAVESEWVWFLWIGIWKQLRPVFMLKKDSISGIFLHVLRIFT